MSNNQSRRIQPPDIGGLLSVIHRREEQEEEGRNYFEDWKDESDDNPFGKLFEII